MLKQHLKVIQKDKVFYAVTKMKNYEDMGSCAYSRDYYVVRLDKENGNMKDRYVIEASNVVCMPVHGETVLPFEETDITLELLQAVVIDGTLQYTYQVENNNVWTDLIHETGFIKNDFLGAIDVDETLYATIAKLLNNHEDRKALAQGKLEFDLSVKIKRKQY